MRRAAILISALFHPLIMPLMCVVIGSELDWYIQGRTTPEQLKLVYLIIGLSTCVFPGLNILLLSWYGTVKNLESPSRKERFLPYVSSTFFFFLGYYLLRQGNLPTAIYSIYIGGLFALVIMAIINTRWKISAHSTAVFGVSGSLAGLFYIHNFVNLFVFSAALIVGGAVLSSRIILKVHTPAQTYVGAILGFVSPFICVRYGLFI